MSSYVTCDGEPVQVGYCIYKCKKECYLHNIYQQGRMDMYEEICIRGYADGYHYGVEYVIEELEKYIELHKQHIFGIGISQIINADELVDFLTELSKKRRVSE